MSQQQHIELLTLNDVLQAAPSDQRSISVQPSQCLSTQPPSYESHQTWNDVTSNGTAFMNDHNSSQQELNNVSRQMIIIQQPDLKHKIFYRKIIFTAIVVIISVIVIRSLYFAFRCDYHSNRRLSNHHLVYNVFRIVENSHYIIRDHVHSKPTTSAGGQSFWFWCTANDDPKNGDLLGQPLKMVNESLTVRNLTEDYLTNLLIVNKSGTNVTYRCRNEMGQGINQLRNVCEQYHLQDRLLSPWHLTTPAKCENTHQCPLVVDDSTSIIGCSVPKVFEQETFHKLFNHHMSNKEHLEPMPRLISLVHSKQLVNYTRMMLTRHPFVRLVQAFRRRFELPKFLPDGNPLIIDHETMHVWTFEEWCEELLLPTNPYQYDPLWAPIWTQCEPCYVEYNFVGKFESFKQNFKDSQNSKFDNKTMSIFNNSLDCDQKSYEEAGSYFRKLKPKTIIELYRKYYLDFELFGYTIQEIFGQ